MQPLPPRQRCGLQQSPANWSGFCFMASADAIRRDAGRTPAHAERRQRTRDHQQHARANPVSDNDSVAGTVSATREHAHALHVIEQAADGVGGERVGKAPAHPCSLSDVRPNGLKLVKSIDFESRGTHETRSRLSNHPGICVRQRSKTTSDRVLVGSASTATMPSGSARRIWDASLTHHRSKSIATARSRTPMIPRPRRYRARHRCAEQGWTRGSDERSGKRFGEDAWFT